MALMRASLVAVVFGLLVLHHKTKSVIGIDIGIGSNCSKLSPGNITLEQERIIVNVGPLLRHFFQDALINETDTEISKEILNAAKVARLIQAKFGRIGIPSHMKLENQAEFVSGGAFTMSVLLWISQGFSKVDTGLRGNPATIVFPLDVIEAEVAATLSETVNSLRPNSVTELLLDATEHVMRPHDEFHFEEPKTLETIFGLLKSTTGKIRSSSPVPVMSVGVVTPPRGNLSLCDENFVQGRSIRSEIIRIVNTVYIKPGDCSRPQHIEECFAEVISEVERCEAVLKKEVANMSVGLVTSTSVFWEDHASRANYWCLMNEYGVRTGHYVMMSEDEGDDFLREYAEGTLKIRIKERVIDRKRGSLIAGVGVGISGLVFVIGVLSLWSYYRRRNIRMRNLMRISGLRSEEISEFLNGSGGEPNGDLWGNMAYNRELEISKEELCFDTEDLLGCGEFGCVYRGYMASTGTEVAIKSVKQGREVATGLRGLMSEIKILSYVGQHENIVNLIGAYTEELDKGILYVITEFCQKGSLEKYLRRLRPNKPASEYTDLMDVNDSEQITMGPGSGLTPMLVQFSLEICSGMKLLADKKVIHGDLAARNILVTQDLHLKISDFGLSRRLYEYTSYVKAGQEPLPWKWMSPEALQVLHFSEKSDVWAYAVTVWEVFSLGNNPYPGISWNPEFPKYLEQGLRLERPELCPQNLYDLMIACWATNPEERPTFKDVLAKIEQIGSIYHSDTHNGF